MTLVQLDLLPEVHVGQVLEVADSDLEATLIRLDLNCLRAQSMEMVPGSLSRWRLEVGSGEAPRIKQAPEDLLETAGAKPAGE